MAVRYITILFFFIVVTVVGCGSGNDGMVLVEEGEFAMGSDSSEVDEGPMRLVFVDSFYMDINEVTNADYKVFTEETKHKIPKDWRIYGYKKAKTDHPVTFVSQGDAESYCSWKGRRLPTEREWEKAARGVDGLIYPWGNKFERGNANTGLSGIVGVTSVGKFEAGKSPYGIMDMAGNVWEWTVSDYNEKTTVVRGGSWGLSHRFARTFTRLGYNPDSKVNNIGFRCVKDA